jgi:hypothetical protein
VIAVNAIGQSEPSPMLFATTKAAAPTAPAGLTFTSATSDSVRIVWNAANPNGSPITSYTVRVPPTFSIEKLEIYE